MNNVIDLSKKRQDYKKFLDINVKGLSFVEVLDYALSHFYALQHSSDGQQPKEYNPILYYDIMACFDPYMMNRSQAHQLIPNRHATWEPWPVFNGIKRTQIFLDEVLIPRREKLRKLINFNNTSISSLERYDTLAQYFMYVKEDISDNEIILNIVYNYDNKIKRIHIKDLKKVCSYLAFNPKSFPRLSDQLEIEPPQSRDIKRMFYYIEDGSNIDVVDENVKLVLKKTGTLDTKIYHIG